jgi:hypothetical protein
MNSMSWQGLPIPEDTPANLRKKVRILVDESLGPAVAEYLRDSGFNAVYAGDVGLVAKSDENVAAYAWRDERMLWTHDRDFLDDQLLPEHRNPGVVVLPGARGDQYAIAVGIRIGLSIFGHGPDVWRKTKSEITAGGEVIIRGREADTGRMVSTRYRLRGKDRVEIWVGPGG